MAHTNTTQNYGLPQWIGTDKPTFLGDLNSAFADIDARMKINSDDATALEREVSTIKTNVQTAQENITALQTGATEQASTNTQLRNLIDTNSDSIDTLNTNLASINEALTGKQAKITGGASSITDSNLTVNRALVSDSSGKVTNSSVTNTELERLSGVTGNIQTQIDNISGVQTTDATVLRGNSDYRVLHKINNIVNFTFEYNGVADFSSPVISIPTGYRPFRNIRYAVWGNAYPDMYAEIHTDGNVYIGGVQSIGASETVYACLTWFTV